MAASIPHHYSFVDYSLMSTEFCEESSNIFNTTTATNMLPLLNYDINSPVSVASFPHESPFGLHSDCMLVPQMSEIETGFRDFSVSDYNQNHVFEPGEDYCSNGFMVPNFYPSYSLMPPENWAIQGKGVTKIEESDQVKVGRYSVEERKDRILRYLKKRNQRNFNKTIKYACRKTLADKRVRVRGRFAKNNDPSQEEILINTTHDTCYQQNNSFHDDSFQMMKCDEDYWLEAAIDNLGQLPYLGS